MSLINQVLLDLEKRHAAESELPLPAYVRVVPGRSQSRMPTFLFIGATLLVLIGIAAFVYYRSGNTSITDVSTPRAALPRPSNPLPYQPAVAVVENTEPVELPVTRMGVSDPVSRLSDELTLVAPHLQAKPRFVEQAQNPSNSAPIVSSRKAENFGEQVKGIPPEAEMPAKPVAQSKLENKQINTSVAVLATTPPAAIDKQMREIAPSEGAEISFRKGAAQIQEGRPNKAELEFREALNQDPSHAGALHALLNLLLANGRNPDAERLVRTALEANPRQPRLAMVLARLEVERGERPAAIKTLVEVLPYAQSDAELYAFLAALLQREGMHKEAVEYYGFALRSAPGNGVWTMGLGISLRASNQTVEAREAFTRAADSGQLSPDLQEFVQRQLRELSPTKK